LVARECWLIERESDRPPLIISSSSTCHKDKVLCMPEDKPFKHTVFCDVMKFG
jgi:hypothetical protein